MTDSSVFPMKSVMTKINVCRTHLMQWRKLSICNVSKSLTEKKHLLKQAEATTICGKWIEAFLKLKSEIQDLLRMEEKLWQQRSHDHWMVSGHSNSKFFHTRATQRFRKNKISELRNLEKVLVLGDSNVSSMMIDYYSKLFTTSEPRNIEEVVQCTKRVVTDEMNTGLIGNFSKEEVMITLKQMAPLKAPRPDGMPPIFFQHHWESIGDDVATTVLRA